MQISRPTGMAGFLTVWTGQVLSLIGTGMSGFALVYWVYQETGAATSVALMSAFFFAPTLLLSPLAGALVDRWNRKLVMALSDLAAGVGTVALLLLYLLGDLQLWHLLAANLLMGAGQAFQFPAYSAAISTMLSKEQYARANGLISLAESGAFILSPILAGVLLGRIGLAGILAIDLITFGMALLALLLVRIPQPRATAEGAASRGSLLQESAFGFRYIWSRPSLLGLQLVFLVLNFTSSLGMPVQQVLILARTGNDAAILGSVLSVSAFGGVAGGLLISMWGGPKRKVHGVLGFMILSGLSSILYGLSQGFLLWAVGGFLIGFAITILNASNQAIWQAKVAPDVQGRVFATRRLIAQVTIPVGTLLGGPLADHLFTPALLEGGALVPLFGGLFGTGPGAGMSLMFALTGLLGALGAVSGYAFRAVREAESILPDHDQLAPAG